MILNGSHSEFRQVRELAASLQHRPSRCQVAIGSVAERLATNRDVEQVWARLIEIDWDGVMTS
jgi:hypothetical protein